jgi:hypothetical protein
MTLGRVAHICINVLYVYLHTILLVLVIVLVLVFVLVLNLQRFCIINVLHVV